MREDDRGDAEARVRAGDPSIDVDEPAVQDFAAEVGITPNNASVRVFRAREALRKQVTNACGTCAEHGCVECTCGKRV